MNLPALRQLQAVSRKPESNVSFLTWGAKKEGIKEGDCIDGILLGFEVGEYGGKNLIIKSFEHNGQPVKIWGCASIQRAIHADTAYTQLIYFPGDVVRVTYKYSYEGKKGLSTGKIVAVFDVEELIGYDLTEKDAYDIEIFAAQQVQKSGLPVYKAPVQQPYAAQQAQQQYVNPRLQQAAQVQQPQYAAATQRASFKKAADDFDM